MSSISNISSNYYSYEHKNATSRTNSSFKSTLTSALDKLVKSGTITDDQEEAISEALSASDGSTSSSAVTFSATSASSSSQSDNPLKSALDSLVSAGTITTDQESSIAAALAPPDANSGTDTNSTSSAKSDSSDNPLKKALDSLVSSGTITDDQESAIAAALAPPSSNTLSGETSSSGSSYLENALDTLVSSGTITDDQENAVTALLTGGNDVSASSYNSLNSCFYSKLI